MRNLNLNLFFIVKPRDLSLWQYFFKPARISLLCHVFRFFFCNPKPCIDNILISLKRNLSDVCFFRDAYVHEVKWRARVWKRCGKERITRFHAGCEISTSKVRSTLSKDTVMFMNILIDFWLKPLLEIYPVKKRKPNSVNFCSTYFQLRILLNLIIDVKMVKYSTRQWRIN